MSPKLLKVHCIGNYDIENRFLSTLPDNGRGMGYAELFDAYRRKSYFRSHGQAAEFARLGWEVAEVIPHFAFFQRRWAEENGLGPDADLAGIFLAQIRSFRPDAVFTDNISQMPVELLDRRGDFPFLRLLVAQKGFPEDFELLARCDLVFASIYGLHLAFLAQGIKSRYLLHSFDPVVLDAMPKTVEPRGFVFSGHSGYGWDWHHRTRYNLLRRLLETMPAFEAWIAERDRTLYPDIEDPLRELFPEKTHPPVYGMDMYALLAGSQLVLNQHPDSSYGYTSNMRMFEAGGVGACTLVDDGLRMRELFEPDEEVVVYASFEECAEKAAYLMDHPAECRAIGDRMRRRVMKDHLCVHRVAEMDREMRARLRES